MPLSQILGESVPRSGHHLLVRGMKGLFRKDMFYCEQYKTKCCQQLPCVNAKMARFAFKKSHDFTLSDNPNLNYPYVIQYRDPVLSTLSHAELKRNYEQDFARTREELEEFYSKKAAYFVKFMEKWNKPSQSNYIIIDYDDLAKNTAAVLERLLQRLGYPKSRKDIAAVVEEIRPIGSGSNAHKGRTLDGSQFYDKGLMEQYEGIVLSRLPYLEEKRKTAKIDGFGDSALYFGYLGHLLEFEDDVEGAAKAFEQAFQRGGSPYFYTLAESRLGDHFWSNDQREEARAHYLNAMKHGLHQASVEKRVALTNPRRRGAGGAAVPADKGRRGISGDHQVAPKSRLAQASPVRSMDPGETLVGRRRAAAGAHVVERDASEPRVAEQAVTIQPAIVEPANLHPPSAEPVTAEPIPTIARPAIVRPNEEQPVTERDTQVQSDHPIYFFAHIPKTGGQTVRLHLTLNVGADKIIYANHADDVQGSFATISEEKRAACQLVVGHRVNADLARFFPGREARFFTILRDPIAHMISSYNWYAYRWIRDNNAEPMTLEEWLKPRGKNNLMSHWLLSRFMGVPPKEHHGYDRERLLEEARAVLKRFWLVAKLEELERTLNPVFRVLGAADTFARSKNIGGRDYEQRVQRTPEVEARLHELVTVDMKIYEEFAGWVNPGQ